MESETGLAKSAARLDMICIRRYALQLLLARKALNKGVIVISLVRF